MKMTIIFNDEKDFGIIEKIRSVENKTDYLRKLIQKDIGMDKDDGDARSKRGRKYEELTGKRFGEWIALERDFKGTKPGCTKWFCKCSCGNISSVSALSLKNGTSTKCQMCKGKQKQSAADPRIRVNGKLTHTYMCWDAIKHRCYYPSQKSYKDYGERGITICDEWKNDYFAFYDYVSKLDRFGEEGMTIDRIDNDRGYEPGNVRWATRAEQNRHRRDRGG